MATENTERTLNADSGEADPQKDIRDSVGELVAGIWVVSGEEMPKLHDVEGAKGDDFVDGGILGRQEKGITYASPKHLKTMVEIWKGMCIATGKPFFDYSVKCVFRRKSAGVPEQTGHPSGGNRPPLG